MSAATLQPPRKRFTRGEVEQMLDAGLFAGQRFELIDGDLIDKIGQNPPHSYALSLLLACLVKIFGVERVRMQQPSEAAPAERERSLPEPDLAVLAELKDDYGRRHPRGNELLLAIEVADTTVRYDATTKRDLYARAGVPEYWVLDIPARRLIVHRGLTQGQFEQIDSIPENASVSAGGIEIPVSELLP
jgi:Uma2 family endonuclease